MKKLFTSLFLLTLIVSLLSSAPVMAETIVKSFVYGDGEWTSDSSVGQSAECCAGYIAPSDKIIQGSDFYYSGKHQEVVERDGNGWTGFSGSNRTITACTRSSVSLSATTYTFSLLTKDKGEMEITLPKISVDGSNYVAPQKVLVNSVEQSFSDNKYRYTENVETVLEYSITFTSAGSYIISVQFTSGWKEKFKASTLTIASSAPAAPTYEVSATASNGTVSGTGSFAEGASVTLTASPADDYSFSGWSSVSGVDLTGHLNDNPLTFTMPANAVSVTANFAACTKHNVTLTAGANGSVSGGGEFCDGSVTVTATPNTGYRFVNWTNTSTSAVVSTDANYTFTLSEDISLTANFEYNPCTNTKLVEAEDYIDGYSAYHFPNGDPKITEDASASNGKYFEFNGNDEYKDGEINYYVYLPAATYSVEIKHRNGKDKYLNIYAADPDGDVTYNTVKYKKMTAYNPNLGDDWCSDWKTYKLDDVELTTGGYYLIGLYGKQYAMFDYVKFTANTGVFCSRTITMQKSGDTSAEESTSSVGSAMVGTKITITAGDASDNHYFVNWSASPAVEFADATSETTTFVMPDADVTITANYASYIYTRDISGAGWGTLCLPMAGSVSGATLFSVAGKQEENSKLYVVLQEEPDLVGGQPYIFEKTAATLTVTMSGPQTPSPATVNGLVGTYVEISSLTSYDESHKNYILAKNGDDVEFQKVGDNVTVGEYRAYMNLDGVLAYSPSQAIPGRRYVMMGVSGTQETEDTEDISAVEEVESGKVLSGKILVNGQLYLMYEGKMYDVRGARVK